MKSKNNIDFGYLRDKSSINKLPNRGKDLISNIIPINEEEQKYNPNFLEVSNIRRKSDQIDSTDNKQGM